MEEPQISIFIPSSFLGESKDLKVRTYKVGLISRSAALFRVNRIVIYSDDQDRKGTKFISDVLNYMNTPQYLRKQVFPISRELRNVGILPPLRTPHHPTGELHQGDYRQGLTVKRMKRGTLVDIGADRLALCKEKLSVNRVLNFKVEKLAKEILITPDEPDVYWGYQTLATYRDLQDSLKALKPQPDLVVGASRLGQPITSVFNEVKEDLKGSKHLAILFGGPYSGLHDLNGETRKVLDLELNTIPHQGTKTVRTEEAVLATLSLFNLLLDL